MSGRGVVGQKAALAGQPEASAVKKDRLEAGQKGRAGSMPTKARYVRDTGAEQNPQTLHPGD